MTTRPWLIFGASGQVGTRVLARCAAAGQTTLALSRQPRKQPSTQAGRWLGARLPDAVPPLPPVDAVLSLGPLDLFAEWLGNWQPDNDAPRIIALSSMSAASKAGSAHAGERALAARMRHAEHALAARCDDLGLPWTLLRPTMLWGGGTDRTLSRLAHLAMRWHVVPQPDARGLRQPLHVDDLAAAVIAAVHRDPARGHCIECGGGERLTVSELFQRVRASAARRSVAIPVPALALRGAARMARFSRGAAAIARLDTDLLADNSKLQALLDVHPRGFSPQAQDWTPTHD